MIIDGARVEVTVIAELVDLLDKRILEIGFGAARETGFLVRSDNSVVALDPDPARLAAAQQLWPQVDFRTQDILSTSWEGEFDLVVFSMSLHHILGLTGKKQALRKARRALKPQGRILVIEPSLRGTVTEVVCAFDNTEERGLREARAVLESEAMSWKKVVPDVEVWWDFDSYIEVVDLFTALARRSDPNVSDAQVRAVLLQLGLEARITLDDIIDFYVL
jgi:SAM-dependent methyltransferase